MLYLYPGWLNMIILEIYFSGNIFAQIISKFSYYEPLEMLGKCNKYSFK